MSTSCWLHFNWILNFWVPLTALTLLIWWNGGYLVYKTYIIIPQRFAVVTGVGRKSRDSQLTHIHFANRNVFLRFFAVSTCVVFFVPSMHFNASAAHPFAHWSHYVFGLSICLHVCIHGCPYICTSMHMCMPSRGILQLACHRLLILYCSSMLLLHRLVTESWWFGKT